MGVAPQTEEFEIKKSVIVFLLILLAGPGLSRGQVGGNIGYSESGGKAKAKQSERAKRAIRKDELPPTGTSTLVECNVLMNVKADEYVAVFGIAREGTTLAEGAEKMGATVKAFTAELKALGIGDEDVFVDFVTQNKTFGYEVEGDILQEKLVGFELKKHLLIHYKQASLLENITLIAARSQVFDLIKVDYIVKDINRAQDRLMEAAALIIKHKISRYKQLLGIKLQPPAQVYAEKSAIHYPTQMYDSYAAYESEAIRDVQDRRKYTVRSARKSRTFFFNGLDGDGFVLSHARSSRNSRQNLKRKTEYSVARTASNRCNKPATLGVPPGATYSTAPIITPGMPPYAASHTDTSDPSFQHLPKGGRPLLAGARCFGDPPPSIVATPPARFSRASPVLLASYSPTSLKWPRHNADAD